MQMEHYAKQRMGHFPLRASTAPSSSSTLNESCKSMMSHGSTHGSATASRRTFPVLSSSLGHTFIVEMPPGVGSSTLPLRSVRDPQTPADLSAQQLSLFCPPDESEGMPISRGKAAQGTQSGSVRPKTHGGRPRLRHLGHRGIMRPRSKNSMGCRSLALSGTAREIHERAGPYHSAKRWDWVQRPADKGK